MERLPTGLGEFDRVLGGGLVPGAVVLLGGDPGIGKSTLLLQVAARLASSGREVVYVSGEEAADQVRLRAIRLGLGGAPVRLAAATSVRDILTTVTQGAPPEMLVIDSIKTKHSELNEGAPATVSHLAANGAGQALIAWEHIDPVTCEWHGANLSWLGAGGAWDHLDLDPFVAAQDPEISLAPDGKALCGWLRVNGPALVRWVDLASPP